MKITKALLITSMLWASVSSVSAQECALAGVWKSDKKKTLPELYKTRLTQLQKNDYSRTLGKTTVEYKDCNQAITKNPNSAVEKRDVRIVGLDNGLVRIEDVETDKASILDLKDNCYSVASKKLIMKEFYCKVDG